MQTPKSIIKIVLNIFPPLLFNRIVLKEISDDFMTMRVLLKRSIFNMNFQKTIFGGSIFSACDPYFPTMYYHIFKKKKKKTSYLVESSRDKVYKARNKHFAT